MVTHTKAERHANSIVDDDQEQFQISRNMAYFLPTFALPTCAYSCNYASETSDNYYGVPLLGILIMLVLLIVDVVVEMGGAFESLEIHPSEFY
jgi:hypothetical protein